MNRNFKIVMSSDSEYEDLCAEIYFQDEFVAIVSQEEGFDNLLIELSSPIKKDNWCFSFSEFIEILQNAKKALWEMRKLS